MLKRNVFGQIIFFKKLLIKMVGFFTYPMFNWKNNTDIQGSSVLAHLPKQNVLLVSNHQTYFADVILISNVIYSVYGGRIDTIKVPSFLWRMRHNVYFVAAEETMNKGLLPRLFKYGGAITVKRTWRKDGENIKRKVDKKDTSNIGRALGEGWVITFPQGTTTPFVSGRKGTAHIIKEYRPTVVPVVINGFRRAFDKKGLFIKKKGTTLSAWFKEPLDIDYDATPDEILEQVMDGIEQSENFNKVRDN
ncbi:lysophospholipid acyltransferase family protein [Halocola ammonii]